LVRLFVFPNEPLAEEDVGEAFAAAGLNGLGLEGEILAGVVIFQRRFMADKGANIVEMGMGDGRFFLLDTGPFGDKFGWGLGGSPRWRQLTGLRRPVSCRHLVA
jgi:hypothetical protein